MSPASHPIGDGFAVRSLALTFRPGAVLGRHAHAWGQLVFASAGVMRVATEAATWLVPPTKAIWIPAGLSHQILFSGEVAMRTLYIAPERAVPLPAAPRTLEVAPLLRELILHILAIGMLDPKRPHHDRMAGLLIDLLLEARPQDLSLPQPHDPRAQTLATLLRERPDDARDLPTLAREAGASLRTLQRIFLRDTGLTLEGWRQKARLIHAVARLTAGASVTEAALASGYRSLGAFISAFSRQFEVTPGRYLAR